MKHKGKWRIDDFGQALAHVRANFDTIVVAYSGGKDSTAALAWCQEAFPHKLVIGVLADTGIEPPGTREYVRQVERIVGVDVTWCDDPVCLKDGSVFRNVFDIARQRGRFPLPGRCEWRGLLKTERIRRWLRAQRLSGPVLVMGQRHEESWRRARLPYFSAGEGWRNGAEIFRPVLEWSHEEVHAYLSERRVPLHPAYALGFKRVSCMPCVAAPIAALELLAQVYPERITRMYELEQELGCQFHPRYSLLRFIDPER